MFCTAGEKYAVTSQCNLPSETLRVKIAMSMGLPASSYAVWNAFSICSDTVGAHIPSPRVNELQEFVWLIDHLSLSKVLAGLILVELNYHTKFKFPLAHHVSSLHKNYMMMHDT